MFTIIGVQEKAGKKQIVKENLKFPELHYENYSGNTHWTNTIFVDEEQNILMTGNEHGNVIQFDLHSGRIVKIYKI